MRALPILIICPALFIACSGPDGGSDPADLIGTWRQVPSTFDGNVPVEMRAVLTLGKDGSYVLVQHDGGDNKTAMYTADGTSITVSGNASGTTFTQVEPYVATSDQLMLGALTPDGSIDGVVGIWGAAAKTNDDVITVSLELRQDNTAHYVHDETTGDSETDDGTWAFDQSDVVFTFKVMTTTVSLHLQQLPGLALGGPLFERI